MSKMIDEEIARKNQQSQHDYVTKDVLIKHIATLPANHKDGFDKNAIKPFPKVVNPLSESKEPIELVSLPAIYSNLFAYKLKMIEFISLTDDNKTDMQEAKEVVDLMFDNGLLHATCIITLSDLCVKQSRSVFYQNAFMYFALAQRIKQAGIEIPKDLTLE